MNAQPDGAGPGNSLRGFYSYKNTFDKSSVWLETPKQRRSSPPSLGRWIADGQLQLPLLMSPIHTPILKNREYKTNSLAQNHITTHRKDING